MRVHAARGLSLIEVMGMLAVSTLLLGGAWRFLDSGLQAYRHGIQDARATQGARLVFTTMTRDIQRAFATALPHAIQGTTHQQASATGSATETERLDLLMLPSISTAPAMLQALHGRPLQRIRYVLEPGPAGGALALKRLAVADDGRFIAIPLNERLLELRVRYYDGDTWSDDWQRPTMPTALEITLAFPASGRQTAPHRFATIVTSNS